MRSTPFCPYHSLVLFRLQRAHQSPRDLMSHRRHPTVTISSWCHCPTRTVRSFCPTSHTPLFCQWPVADVAPEPMAALFTLRPVTPMDGRGPRPTPPYWRIKDVRTFKTKMLLAQHEVRLCKILVILLRVPTYQRKSAWFMAGATPSAASWTPV